MRRLQIISAIFFVLALVAGAGISGSSAQADEAEQTDFEKVTSWQLSRPGLEMIGASADAVVVETDFGLRRISTFDQTVLSIDFPAISQVADYYVLYCDENRLAIYTVGTLKYDTTAANLGVDSIVSCWMLEHELFLLSTVNGQNQITAHQMRDGVPEAGVVKIEIDNPVAFEDAGQGGLLITNAAGESFHNSKWGWDPRPNTVGDFYVGQFPATRDGDTLTLYLQGVAYQQYVVPEAVTDVFGAAGSVLFVSPTGNGTSVLTADPMRLGDAQSYERTVELPFVPDRVSRSVYGTFIESGDMLAFVPDLPVVLSQSHQTYQAFSDEAVTLRMWGVVHAETWDDLVTDSEAVIGGTYYDMPVDRVKGGLQFVPPLMKPGEYGFRFQGSPFKVEFQMTMEGWHEMSEVRLSAPESTNSRFINLVCWLEGHSDADVQWTVTGTKAEDITSEIPVGANCTVKGEGGWWGVVGEDVVYDYLDWNSEFTATDQPVHLQLTTQSQQVVPLWIYLHRSGGASEASREIELLCANGEREVFVVQYDQATRIELTRRFDDGKECYIVALEDDNSDLVGIYEYLDLDGVSRAFREGMRVDFRRPAWYDINELIIHPLDDSPQFVTQQYSDFLGREPSAIEINAWSSDLDSGRQSQVDLVMNLLGSLEYQNVADPNIRLYKAYFDRLPDAEGLQYWMDIRRSGYSIDLVSEQFTLSAEFRNLYGDTTDADFIELVYENVLRRTPDAEGYSYWQNLLSTGQISRGQLMVNFSESAEYTRLNARTVRVVRTYVALLDRVPGAAELAAEEAGQAFGSTLRELVARIVNGDEYESRFWDHYRGERIVNLTAGLTDDLDSLVAGDLTDDLEALLAGDTNVPDLWLGSGPQPTR